MLQRVFREFYFIFLKSERNVTDYWEYLIKEKIFVV